MPKVKKVPHEQAWACLIKPPGLLVASRLQAAVNCPQPARFSAGLACPLSGNRAATKERPPTLGPPRFIVSRTVAARWGAASAARDLST